MQFAERLVIHFSRHLGEPIIKGTEKTEKNATNDYVVKVCNHKIRIAQLPVEWGCAQHDSGETRSQELEKKSDTEQHGSLEQDLYYQYRCQRIEDLYCGWNGNIHVRYYKKSVVSFAHAD